MSWNLICAFPLYYLFVQDTVESKPLADPVGAVPPGKLYAAVEQGNLEAVKEILLHATADDVNYQASNEVLLEGVRLLCTPLLNIIPFARTNGLLLQKRLSLGTVRSCRKF